MFKKLIFYFLLIFSFCLSKKWYGDSKEVFAGPIQRYNFVVSTAKNIKKHIKDDSDSGILIWYNSNANLYESTSRPIACFYLWKTSLLNELYPDMSFNDMRKLKNKLIVALDTKDIFPEKGIFEELSSDDLILNKYTFQVKYFKISQFHE